MKPREINEIIIHCSDTKPGMDIGVKDIDNWHRLERGWDEIGYHFVIRLDGRIEFGRSINKQGAHCKGHNAHSIGICYVGGRDKNGKPADTRTTYQKEAFHLLLDFLTKVFPISKIHGHRFYNNLKDCPCFDVESEYSHYLL